MPRLPLALTPLHRWGVAPPRVAARLGQRFAAWWSARTAPLRRTRRPAEILLLGLAMVLAAAVLYALLSPINRRH